MRSLPRAVSLVAFTSCMSLSLEAFGQGAPPPPPPPGLVAPLPPPAALVPVAPLPPPSEPVAIVVSAPPPPPPAAPAPTSGPTLQLLTLRMMRDKGIITQAEYDSALRDIADSNGAKGAESNTFVAGKWSTTLYGFAEADYMFDSTESYNDIAGSGLIAPSTTYAGNHPRSQFSIRNSRIGFRFRAPEYHAIRASAVIETDFFGDWASPTYTGATGQPSENAFFTNPVLRVRHAYMKIENPVVDVLFGQYWHLFGWQTVYHPNTVEIQGVPGEVYARTPQLRLSKTFASPDVTFDIAIAAARPPQRDSGYPEGEGGLHIAFNKWMATQTMGATGTQISPASIAVTGDVRKLGIADYPTGGTLAAPVTKSIFEVQKVGGSVSAEAFLPILPAKKDHMGNSLSILGEFVYGYGNGDLYSGLASGLASPTLTGVPPGSPAGTVSTTAYNPQIDPGLAFVSSTGGVTLIGWQTIRAGIQYYLPGLDGKMWISANYANVTSPNVGSLFTTTTPAMGAVPAVTNKSTLVQSLNWFDVNIMGDLTPAVRLGVEYALSADKYQDGKTTAQNHRVQGSAFYIF